MNDLFNPFLETPMAESPAERRNRQSAEYETWMATAKAGPPDTLPPAPQSVMRLLSRIADAGARVAADLGLDRPAPTPPPGPGRLPVPETLGRGRGWR